jgi:excisionase family DNA binding protein
MDSCASVFDPQGSHSIAAYREGERQERGELTVDEAATSLNVTHTTVLRLIHQKELSARQVCRNAPWTIRQADLDEFLAARAEQGPSTHVAGQLGLDIQ